MLGSGLRRGSSGDLLAAAARKEPSSRRFGSCAVTSSQTTTMINKVSKQQDGGSTKSFGNGVPVSAAATWIEVVGVFLSDAKFFRFFLFLKNKP